MHYLHHLPVRLQRLFKLLQVKARRSRSRHGPARPRRLVGAAATLLPPARALPLAVQLAACC